MNGWIAEGRRAVRPVTWQNSASLDFPVRDLRARPLFFDFTLR
jgi:hypothetical protein